MKSIIKPVIIGASIVVIGAIIVTNLTHSENTPQKQAVSSSQQTVAVAPVDSSAVIEPSTETVTPTEVAPAPTPVTVSIESTVNTPTSVTPVVYTIDTMPLSLIEERSNTPGCSSAAPMVQNVPSTARGGWDSFARDVVRGAVSSGAFINNDTGEKVCHWDGTIKDLGLIP